MNRAVSAKKQPRTFVRAMGLTFAGQGGLLLLGTLSSILAARLLGPTGKGQLVTATIAAGVLGLLTELGLRAAVIRVVAAGRATWKEGLATMMVLYGSLCVIVLPLANEFFVLFHQRLFPHIPLYVLQIALAGIPIGLIEGSLTSTLIGHQHMPEVSAVWVMEKMGVIFGLVVLVLVLGFGVTGAVVAQLAGVIIGITIALGLLSRLPGGVARIRFDLVGELLRFGSVWYGRNLATSLNYRLDALLVFHFQGGFAAGLYAVAVSIAELLQYLPNTIDSVLFPNVSRGEAIAIEVRTARLSRFTVFVTVIGILLIALFGYPVIYLFFGPSFTGGFPALLLLLPGMLALAQSKIIFSELLGRGYAKYPAIASWVALIATVTLDFLLIPTWGIIGAALASTVAYTISALVGMRFYRDITGIGPRTLYVPRYVEIVDIVYRLGNVMRRR
ncbi:MAG TPA: oligosaccharide flippase family protein [Armatimonadota bacterium]|nr:oligosaccharide flippase family protein [Armatimonadota bacterium]